MASATCLDNVNRDTLPTSIFEEVHNDRNSNAFPLVHCVPLDINQLNITFIKIIYDNGHYNLFVLVPKNVNL